MDPFRVFTSDFFDFSIYVDADERHLETWYVERFLRLRDTALRDRAPHYHRYEDLSLEEARAVARRLWTEINAVNLRANIAPTREYARLILEKGASHAVELVRVRRVGSDWPRDMTEE
jgi:type I pantothenate kinase